MKNTFMKKPFIAAKAFIAVLAVAAFSAGPTLAQEGGRGGLDNAFVISQVESYLQNLPPLKARFVQTASDGTRATGDFMLKRPGRMRFEYDPPIEDFITADGAFIYYYDGKLKEQQNAPISRSLADFFLREDVRLGGDIRVLDIRRVTSGTGGDILEITVAQEKDPFAGSLTLGLVEKPQMTLRYWRVADAQGAVTTVALSDIVTGITLRNDIFRYYDPKRRESQYN